jgi:hypothetical protein
MASIIISSASVLVALVSVFFSFRSSRIARRGLVSSNLIVSLGDMVASLHALESAALKIDSEGIMVKSRKVLWGHFDEFRSANTVVGFPYLFVVLAGETATGFERWRTMLHLICCKQMSFRTWSLT